MDLLDRNALWSLMEEGAERCVSIYLPTHRAGSDIQQDPIRLKNLLRRAEESLRAKLYTWSIYHRNPIYML